MLEEGVNPETTSAPVQQHLNHPTTFKLLRSYGSECEYVRGSDDIRMSRMKAKIERFEAQWLACGQPLELCESEKASLRSELYYSLDLTRVRGESREKYRTIDGTVKTDLDQTRSLLRVAEDARNFTANSLRAEVEQLREAAPLANNERDTSRKKQNVPKAKLTIGILTPAMPAPLETV